MFDDDDPDDEGEDLFPDTGKPKTSEPRETRQEREEKLRKMMEDDGMPKTSNSAVFLILT